MKLLILSFLFILFASLFAYLYKFRNVDVWQKELDESEKKLRKLRGLE